MGISIRPLEPADFPQWLPLWNANNEDHTNPEVTTETWMRINDPVSPVNGLAAFIDGKMAGLVHYILHPVTGHIAPACYMQDLYVDPAFRRRGIGRTLVEHLTQRARQEKWARLYWLAAGQNEGAQALYRNLGLKLDFSFHVMPLS